MQRRQLLTAAAGTTAGAVSGLPQLFGADAPPTVLVHEHVLVDFRVPTAQRLTPAETDAAFAAARPHLVEIARLGCRRFLDCTPAFLGRNPRLLARLAGECGIDIWTNTGWYAARERRYLPEVARTETATGIARRWLTEIRDGVDGLKPRFIKIGVNRAPLHPLDRKIVEAAAFCSRESGLTVASHTGGGGAAALEQLAIFAAQRADLARFVWVHADGEKDHALHEQVARAGAWVEFDHVSPANLEFHVAAVRHLAARGLLNRTLISQDAGYYRPGEPGGGGFRPYSYLYTAFLARLDPQWRPALMSVNPVAAFGGGALG